MGTVPKVRGGDVGVYIPPVFRKYYYDGSVYRLCLKRVSR